MAGITPSFNFKNCVLEKNHVLLWIPQADATETKGGIIIPTQSTEKIVFDSIWGIVAKVGEDVKICSRAVHIGDKAIHTYYAGIIIESEETGQTYRLIEAKDIKLIQPSEYNSNHHFE